MSVDTHVSTLVINEMTKAQYLEKKTAGELSDTELYFVTDDEGTLDEVLDTTSTNAVQNKAIAAAIEELDEKIDSEVTTLGASVSLIDTKATEAGTTATAANTAAGNAQAKADSAYDLANAKQAKITTTGILKGAGNGNVSAAVSGTDYEAPGAAAQALSSAKSYADGLNTTMDARVDELEGATHTHGNKSLLDTYTQTNANITDAVSKKHEHSNLSVLEGITAAKVSAWDTASGATIDDTLSTTSTNPVQNKVVNAAIEDVKATADANLATAKAYTDTKTSSLATASSVDSKVSAHNTATTAHNDIRELITGLTTRLNALADSDDTTLDQMSEIVEYIKSNRTLIESVTTNKVNVSDIVTNLTTNSNTTVLAASQGVALKALIDALQADVDSHTHAIADVTGLQSALDGKAASSHGTHVSYSTTVPVMDGTATAGTATAVARSDHKHPTDTSRASQADLTALTNTVSGKADVSHTHDNRYYTESEIDVKVDALTASVDGKQPVITGAATTITESNLTANRALVSNASGKVAVSDVTATELGYLDGVTSNIQTQFSNVASTYETKDDATAKLSAAKAYADTVASGKAAVSHTHDDRYYTETEIDTKIDNINSSIAGKAASSHSHTVGDVTGLQTSLDDIDTKLNASIKSLSVSGTTITYTKTDGSTDTITTQDTNTDTKVTATKANTTKAYITGTTSASTNTGTLVFDTGVYLDTTSGTLTATSFNGKATSAASADRATSATKATQDASGNVITSTYETKSDASSKLSEAKTYADNAALTVKNDLLNGAGAAYDTLKELGDLIDTNTTAIDALETVASNKMDKVNPEGSGTFSFGRLSGSTTGTRSIVLGSDATASGKDTVTLGRKGKATGSYATSIGYGNEASGDNSVVIGVNSTASSGNAMAIGSGSKATNWNAVAIGATTTASGNNSTAMGYGSEASGWISSTSGYMTKATGAVQTVLGSLNVADTAPTEDTGKTTNLVIVGNGDYNAETTVNSNAATLDWDGNAWFAGEIYIGSTSGTNKDTGSLKVATESFVANRTVPSTKVTCDYPENGSMQSQTLQWAIETLANAVNALSTETWTFELEDGSTVTKNVVVS